MNVQTHRENAFGGIFANSVCFPIQEGRPKCIWQIQHQRRAILTAFAASWPNRAVSPGDTRSPVTARLDQVRPFRRPHIRWFCRADSSHQQVASNQICCLFIRLCALIATAIVAFALQIELQELQELLICCFERDQSHRLRLSAARARIFILLPQKSADLIQN